MSRPSHRTGAVSRILQALTVSALFALGCGGLSDSEATPELAPSTELGSLENDVVDCHERPELEGCEGLRDEPFLGVFEWGVVPDGMPVPKGFGIDVNGAQAFIPTLYGNQRSGPGTRCLSDSATWVDDCKVPQNRQDKFYLDLAQCESVNTTLAWNGISSAVFAFIDYSNQWTGWKMSVTGIESESTYIIRCSNTQEPWATTYQVQSFCWNLPNRPKDLCFQSEIARGSTVVALDDILAAKGSGLGGVNFTQNVIWHELMHVTGLGHDTTDGSIMNVPYFNAQAAGFLIWPLPALTDRVSDFSRFLVPCNWQVGDPLGDACPHRG